VIEYYVHTTEIRERHNFRVENYEEPLENFINVDTTLNNPDESINSILKQL